MATITVPALKNLPTASHASHALKDVKRRTRKHALRLAQLASGCFLFAWVISSKRRKHPYLVWVSVSSILGSFGVDFWFHRDQGLMGWSQLVIQDVGIPTMRKKSIVRKEDDLVVVGAEQVVNGESVERDMNHERRLQQVRAWLSGAALTMGIIGLWGDGT
jgi:autophagy-related protein 33